MMIEEFTARTGYKPTFEEYHEIEKLYYAFDGDKDEFCAYWDNHNKARELVRSTLHKLVNRVYKREGGNTPFTNAVADYVNFFYETAY